MDLEKIKLINELSEKLSDITQALAIIEEDNDRITIGRRYEHVAGLCYVFHNSKNESAIISKIKPIIIKELNDMMDAIKTQLKEL